MPRLKAWVKKASCIKALKGRDKLAFCKVEREEYPNILFLSAGMIPSPGKFLRNSRQIFHIIPGRVNEKFEHRILNKEHRIIDPVVGI